MTMLNISRSIVGSRSLYLVLVGMGLGYLAGISASPSSTARAEVTEEPRREAFKAGGVLNEPILREIAATLVRIETRVERIERNMNPGAPAKSPATGKTTTTIKSGPVTSKTKERIPNVSTAP